MTKLQEFLEYQRKQCENDRKKYGNNNLDNTIKEMGKKAKLDNSNNVKNNWR